MVAGRWKRYYTEEYPVFWLRQSEEYMRDGWTATYYNLILSIMGCCRGKRVLDCGIGTGKPFALTLAKSGAQMHGVDISSRLVQECLRNFTNAGLEIRCAQADVESLPYPDGFFDLVYSISTTWYLPDLEKALAEMTRVTAPGGSIVFDIINLLHPTQSLMYFYSKVAQSPFGTVLRALKRRVQGFDRNSLRPVGPWKARHPWYVGRLLRWLSLE